MYKRLVAGINNMIMCMCEGMCMPIMCCVNFIKIFPASNIKSIRSLCILPKCT